MEDLPRDPLAYSFYDFHISTTSHLPIANFKCFSI